MKDMKERSMCAEFFRPENNCHYAKVVEEKGQYPVITFNAKVTEDGKFSNVTNLNHRIDDTAWLVYCTHPNCPGKKEEHGVFIGSMEPYSYCPVPYECPEIQSKIEKSSEECKKGIWTRIKKAFCK